MRVITRKGELKEEMIFCTEAYTEQGLEACWREFDQRILQAKVKFPLLEFCASILYELLDKKEQLSFCDWVSKGGSEGGNVILGILLQKRMPNYFEESVQKTAEYIAAGQAWYVSDIIGERVWGFTLLYQTEEMLNEMRKLAKHPSHWVVRSLGAGAHYAIKKGLAKDKVHELFGFLLSLASSKNYEIRRGIGWAAKTTGKFHPEIIAAYQKQIDDAELTGNWFRSKVNMGLNRNAYAQRNRS